MIEEKTQREAGGSQANGVPRKAGWKRHILGGAVLATLGAVALLAQGLGLRSLVEFGGEKESWKAAQAQRQSLAQEHQKLIDERMVDLGKVQTTYQQLKAETEVAHGERDQLVSELTRVRKELELVRSARNEAVKQQDANNQQLQRSLAAKQDAEAKTTGLAAKESELTSEIARLTSDRDQIGKSVLESKDNLKQYLSQITDSQKQADDLQKKAADALVKLREQQQAVAKAGTELQVIIAERDRAGIQRDDALSQANAAKQSLKLQLEELRKLKGDQESIKALNEQLLATAAGQQKDKAAMDAATVDATAKLKQVDGAVAIRQGELSALQLQLKQCQKDLESVQQDVTRVKALAKPMADQNQQVDGELASKQEELSAARRRIDAAKLEERKLLESLRGLNDQLRAPIPTSQPSKTSIEGAN